MRLNRGYKHTFWLICEVLVTSCLRQNSSGSSSGFTTRLAHCLISSLLMMGGQVRLTKPHPNSTPNHVLPHPLTHNNNCSIVNAHLRIFNSSVTHRQMDKQSL